MSENVYWVMAATVKDGKLEDFKALLRELVSEKRTSEPGTLNYEWTLSEDARTCHIYERFADSAAVLAHLAGFPGFAERFMAVLAPTDFVVYGDPSAEVREALAPFGAVFMTPVGGFAR